MISVEVVAQLAIYVFMGLSAACCIYGYSQLDKNARRGHGLMALGSAGWALAAPNTFFLLQSLFFLWVAARGYERAGQNTAKAHR